MKYLGILTLALLFTVACTQIADTGKKELDETAEQNLELVKKMVQAYENEDIDALKEIYSPDLVSIGPSIDHEFNYDTIMASNEYWFKQADSIKFNVITMLPETVDEGDLAGDWVLLWANVSWYNIKSGKKLIVMYHTPLQIEEGRIVYEVDYWNQWDVFKQLGAELEWPDDDEGDEEDDD